MALAPIKQKYAELVAFFQWWIPTYLPNANMYLQGQAAPRPANPYVAFNPLESVEVVGRDERRIISNTDEVLRGQRLITCVLEGYSDSTSRFDGTDTAWDMLQELRFSLAYPDVLAKLDAINCRILEEGSVVDASATLNTTNEPKANMRFVISTVILQSIDNGAIETINATGELSVTFGTKQADVSVVKP